MTSEIVPADVAILDLLRKREAMSVLELAAALGVTSTAVRQRLVRLMGQDFIERETIKAARGRPSHRYRLTTKGRRRTGANFADLAVALWDEIRSIQDADVRRGLLTRISRRLASAYGREVNGATLAERMESLAGLFGERNIPFEVTTEGQLPVLNALACPYPELAEHDPTICAVERMLFSDLLGEGVKLSQCRLEGATCCTFEVSEKSSPKPAEAKELEPDDRLTKEPAVAMLGDSLVNG